MDKKNKVVKEIIWFICSIIGGVILSFTLYGILGVGINLENSVLGIIVVLVAVYVVRLTLWVLKESI